VFPSRSKTKLPAITQSGGTACDLDYFHATHRRADTSPEERRNRGMIHPVKRVAALTSAMAVLVAVLIAVVALPASAATRTRTPDHTSTDLLVGGLSLAGIVLVAGAVLWYTVRTRRSL
jgi:uncharacterized membrane-anchored protein